MFRFYSSNETMFSSNWSVEKKVSRLERKNIPTNDFISLPSSETYLHIRIFKCSMIVRTKHDFSKWIDVFGMFNIELLLAVLMISWEKERKTSTWLKINFVCRHIFCLFVFIQSWKTLDQVVEDILSFD